MNTKIDRQTLLNIKQSLMLLVDQFPYVELEARHEILYKKLGQAVRQVDKLLLEDEE